MASLFLHQDMVFLHHQQRLLQSAGIDAHNFHKRIYTPNGQDSCLLRFKVCVCLFHNHIITSVICISKAVCCSVCCYALLPYNMHDTWQCIHASLLPCSRSVTCSSICPECVTGAAVYTTSLGTTVFSLAVLELLLISTATPCTYMTLYTV
jgi:hypothetical protein